MQVLLQSVAAFFVQLSGTIGITKLGSYYKVALYNLSGSKQFVSDNSWEAEPYNFILRWKYEEEETTNQRRICVTCKLEKQTRQRHFL